VAGTTGQVPDLLPEKLISLLESYCVKNAVSGLLWPKLPPIGKTQLILLFE
jgi:hypothetical protein